MPLEGEMRGGDGDAKYVKNYKGREYERNDYVLNFIWSFCYQLMLNLNY